MNIAHVVPESIKFPLTKHNGSYIWVDNFINKVSEHANTNIYIFCNAESSFQNKNIKVIGLENKSENHDENNSNLFKKALSYPNIDLYHSHFDNLHYQVASLTSQNILFTQHWKLTAETIEFAAKFHPENVFAIPVTKFQQNLNVENNIKTTENIYHGVDLTMFKPIYGERNNKFVFIGRIAKHKGVKEAVQIALNTGIKLDIYGKVEKKDEEYFAEIKELLTDSVKYL